MSRTNVRFNKKSFYGDLKGSVEKKNYLCTYAYGHLLWDGESFFVIEGWFGLGYNYTSRKFYNLLKW